MLSDQEHFYLQHSNAVNNCLQALRFIIKQQVPELTEEWKYRMPFFCLNGKMFCYLWVHKKLRQPYLGIANGNLIDHPGLIIEKRSRMKIMLFDEAQDLPVEEIKEVLQMAYNLTQ